MKYEEHLEQYRRKQEEEAKRARFSQEERLIGLKLALEEGQRLIEEVIRPELEELEGALIAAGISARVVVIRGKEQGIDADFSVVISCAAGTPPIKTLEFKACAESKTFNVHIYTRAEDEVCLYNEITPEFVKSRCGNFLSTAFPV